MESARSPDTLSTGSRSRRGAGRHTTLTLKRPPPLTSDSNHLHNHANHARKSWRSDVPIILPGWEAVGSSVPKHRTSPNVKPYGRVKSHIFFFVSPISNLLSSLFFPSSLNQLPRNFSSCAALYSRMTSASSFGNAPLSRKTFSLTRFHNPFCAVKLSISNLFRSL